MLMFFKSKTRSCQSSKLVIFGKRWVPIYPNGTIIVLIQSILLPLLILYGTHLLTQIQ